MAPTDYFLTASEPDQELLRTEIDTDATLLAGGKTAFSIIWGYPDVLFIQMSDLLTGPEDAALTAVVGAHAGTPTPFVADANRRRITNLDSPYTPGVEDFIVVGTAAGPVVIQLNEVAESKSYVIQLDNSANPCTITPFGSETISGSATWVLQNPGDGAQIIPNDVTSWRVVSSNAVHYNRDNEITSMVGKVPISADVLMIEDSAAGFTKKKVLISDLPGAAGGEANTASNVNASGVGVFKQKTAADLEFRGLVAASAKATIVLDAPTNEIRVDVADASATQAGAIEIALQAEVDTGTDTTRAIVPATLAGSALAGDVTTNNAKVTNANHTGDVTGATALTIAANAVTLAKMATLATARFVGRVTAGIGDPEAMTGTQATTLLDQFTSALQGVTPASGGGTANFLRADGSWAAPPGGAAVWTVATETTAARSAASAEFVLIDAATCVVTLPAPVADSRVACKAIAVPATATSIEIRTNAGGVTIDGTDYSATGLALASQYEQIGLISDGTNWFIY